MLRVRTGASGYVFEMTRKDPTHKALLSRLERTNDGLEFKELLKVPTMVIKGEDYQGVTATSTRYLIKGDYLEWLAENGFFYSLQSGQVKPLARAPELNAQASSLGFTVRGLPTIGAAYNGLRVKGFNGILRGDMVFNGSIDFSII